jgi:septal ring factor EnvC (AmiA/AmiB activator)
VLNNAEIHDLSPPGFSMSLSEAALRKQPSWRAARVPSARVLRALTAALLTCVPLSSAAAQESTAVEEADVAARQRAEEIRLLRVRSEIEELREQIHSTEAKTGSVLDVIDEIDLSLALLAREAESLKAERRAAHAREEAAQLRASDLRRALAVSENAVRRMLNELYRAGPTRYLRVVAISASPAQVAAGQRAVEAISLGETQRMREYSADQSRLDESLRALARESEELARLSRDLEGHEQDLIQTRKRKEAVLAGLKRERSSQKAALGELAQLESDIRELLQTLKQRQPDGSGPSLGFARFRGLLGWPVAGRVAVPFGNVRHPRFGTQVPHHGLEIGVSSGQEVRTVFDGRVVFSSWFRGYGQMIVIDHADGYLSIYGQVAERLVIAGQEVHQGDVIARSGDSGAFDSPGLYFEIRHDGKPEDPALWLRRTQGTVAGRTRGAVHQASGASRSVHR